MSKDERIRELEEEIRKLKEENTTIKYAVYVCKQIVLDKK